MLYEYSSVLVEYTDPKPTCTIPPQVDLEAPTNGKACGPGPPAGAVPVVGGHPHWLVVMQQHRAGVVPSTTPANEVARNDDAVEA